ncbi:unnamed protein product [Calicophoron daubneyi]|uniref:Phosphatidylinositol-glycan biosynthesis class F protein n=1 Tax=Calicophoron daubneyi TaxID=300641 RepID=A0AAV2TIR4_CALDB
MPGFFENVFTLLRSVVFYIFICVFLGAPLLEKHIETLSLAILLTCFTTVPLISIEECTTSRINSIYFSPNQPHEWFLAFLGYGSLFGAWASAGLLILDWNRPWQAWPYPCMMGAVCGAVIGTLFYLIYPFVRRRLFGLPMKGNFHSKSIAVNPFVQDVKVRLD